jgi:hypothetical protein
VLQSRSDLLHVQPSSSSETCATFDGACDVSYINVEEDEDLIEEVFRAVNETDIGTKQEEIAGDITFPDMKSESDEVSYVCI